MNNAELYEKNNSLQSRGVFQTLEEFAIKIKWRNDGDRIIDIGCGDGSVTMNILKRHIPRNFKKLVGCDVSPKMIDFANKNYGNQHTVFKVVDIEGILPEDMRRGFDHAFSFYTLHWIKNQEKAFENIYNLLAEGGDCLLVILCRTPLFEVYRILARNTRWQPWLKDVDRYVAPYHDAQEPDKYIIELMKKVGFKNVDVSLKKMRFVYESTESFKDAVKAVMPFKIPKHMLDEYMDDFMEVLDKILPVARLKDSDASSVIAEYCLSIAYGSK